MRNIDKDRAYNVWALVHESTHLNTHVCVVHMCIRTFIYICVYKYMYVYAPYGHKAQWAYILFTYMDVHATYAQYKNIPHTYVYGG